jgi:hypothetical protein
MICTAAISGHVRSAVQRSLVPSCAPATDYVAIPEGSSSAAPVITPGPRDFNSNRIHRAVADVGTKHLVRKRHYKSERESALNPAAVTADQFFDVEVFQAIHFHLGLLPQIDGHFSS